MKPSRKRRVYYVENVKVINHGRIHLRREWWGIVFLIWLALFCGGILNLIGWQSEWREVERRTVELEKEMAEFAWQLR